jgi:protein TonB
LVVIVLLGFRKGKEEPLPPIYKVNIVAAPPGPRAIGVVQPPTATPKPAAPTVTPPAPPKTKEPAVPLSKPVPKKAATRATPTEKPAEETPPANAPKAGGGPIGGKGTDVATVQTEGIDFPFPGYLENIVRQIALRFKPSDNSGRRAEVRFVIRRDGSVIGFGFVKRSGSYAFDAEAQGAVEEAGKYFGQLPEGFRDDALPVVFSFDPSFIR